MIIQVQTFTGGRRGVGCGELVKGTALCRREYYAEARATSVSQIPKYKERIS